MDSLMFPEKAPRMGRSAQYTSTATCAVPFASLAHQVIGGGTKVARLNSSYAPGASG